MSETQRRHLIRFKKSAASGCSIFIRVGALIVKTPGHLKAAFRVINDAGSMT
jgi:hypothetical protein